MAAIDILARFSVVEFSCETFKGCDLSQDDIMQWLITFGLVESMDEAGSDYYGDTKYCGDGVLGDAICVDSSGRVFLHRGQLRQE